MEYLINGIPANVGAPPPQAQPAAEGAQGQGAALGGQHLGVDQLRLLFNHPQFAQIRQIIRQNPQALQPILAQIAQSSPQLYNLISQHPEEFEQIIMEGDDEGGQEGGEGAAPQQPPPGTIMISQADELAINNVRNV